MQDPQTSEQEKLEALCAMSFDFARENDTKSLSTLLDYGLNVNLSNHQGNTLLMLASYNNNFEATELLLQRGAEVDKKNDKNQTPLAGVCFKGHFAIAKLLLEYGANPHEDNGMGFTPINCAILFRRKEILDLLLRYSDRKLTWLQRLARFFLRVKSNQNFSKR